MCIAGVVVTGELLIAVVVDTGDKHPFAISPQIFEQILNDPMEYSGADSLIYEKNLQSKISCQTSSKKMLHCRASIEKTMFFSFGHQQHFSQSIEEKHSKVAARILSV